jgi:deazaflavin-dependent oxidoreductase (nitroreductase family)
METERGAITSDDDYCYLKTKGRVTGRPHEIEIWFARQGDTIYVLSGGGLRSDWIKNLAKTPHCTVRLGSDGQEFQAIARILDEATPESDDARKLLFDKYKERYAGDLSSWRDRAIPVALDLRRALRSN